MDVPLSFDVRTAANLALSGILALFAVTVGALGRFRGPARWYALFGLSLALTTTAGSLAANAFLTLAPVGQFAIDPGLNSKSDVAFLTVLTAATGTFGGLWTASVAGLLSQYGVRRIWNSGPVWGLYAAFFALFLWQQLAVLGPAPGQVPPLLRAASIFQGLTTALAVSWMVGGGALLARVSRADPGPAILAAAFVAYPVLNGLGSGRLLIEIGAPPGLPLLGAISALVVAVAWAQQRTRAARRVRGTALVFLVAGTLIGLYAPIVPLAGLARLFDVLLVGYAILKLHYLDLDIKVRWGLSKTTVAALFIAVFFVVSELAAATFSNQWGTEIGIVAAGLLVFGIAPIMRWADRFANRAVPPRMDVEGVFRDSLRLALRDGRIDPEEDVALAAQAEKLGISPTRMMELRREANT